MTSPTRVRVLTPEALDAAAANLVNTSGSQLSTAVANHAGTGTATVTGSTTAGANTLMQRDANGRSQIATPSVSADIASKGYVDTAIAGVVATSTKGQPSGVASLDSTGYVPANQLAPGFPRNLGAGTTFPASPNLGDMYFHSGVGCAFRWGGTRWEQMGRCTVANRTARNSLLNNYNSVLPLGFQATQTDYGWIWIKDGHGWAYGGWEGSAASVFSTIGNAGPVFKYQSLNFPVANAQGLTVTNMTFSKAGGGSDTERELITVNSGTGIFTVNDRCLLTINGDAGAEFNNAQGRWDFDFFPPGASAAIDCLNIGSETTSVNGVSGATRALSWTGFAEAASTFRFAIFQYNGPAFSQNFNVYASIHVQSV